MSFGYRSAQGYTPTVMQFGPPQRDRNYDGLPDPAGFINFMQCLSTQAATTVTVQSKVGNVLLGTSGTHPCLMYPAAATSPTSRKHLVSISDGANTIFPWGGTRWKGIASQNNARFNDTSPGTVIDTVSGLLGMKPHPSFTLGDGFNSTRVRDLTDASWASVNITAAKNAANAMISDSANLCSSLTATDANGTCLLTTTGGNIERVFQAYVRRKTGTGTIYLEHGATETDITSLLNTTEYVQVYNVVTANNPTVGFKIATSGDAIEVDVVFTHATSADLSTGPIDYYPGATQNSACGMALSGHSSVQNSGTICLELVIPLGACPKATYGILAAAGQANPLLRITNQATIDFHDGTAVRTGPAVTFDNTMIQRVAVTWSGSSAYIYYNNVKSSALTYDGGLTAFTTCNIGGAFGSNQTATGCYFREYRSYATALTDAQLGALGYYNP